MAAKRYLVVGQNSWSREVFDNLIAGFPGEWTFLSQKCELTEALLSRCQPRYLFFLHWSYLVPREIVQRYECVCFHMTDLPYGRGGSPLQNLIVRGHTQTVVTALRMDEGLDSGPVYQKVPLALTGSAQEIYRAASVKCAELIEWIIRTEPVPAAQTGEPVFFQRRTPPESRIAEPQELTALYDFIRMLDAEGYPQAFLEQDGFRYTFSGAELRGGRIEARVTIEKKNDDDDTGDCGASR